MTREQIRQYVLDNPMKFKPLSPWQRAQLAVILRPDLPGSTPVAASDEDPRPGR